MKIFTEVFTDVGGRDNNEDFAGYIKSDHFYCWIVCDGLGGHERGEVASRFIVEYLLNRFRVCPTTDETIIQGYIVDANKKLLEQQNQRSGIKTTLTMVIFDGNDWVFAHVGDSRIYYLDQNNIIYQSRDHSVPQMLYELGEITREEIRGHEDSNRLLKVLGMEWDKPKYEIKKIPHTKKNKGIILCSDGFWEYVLEEELLKTFAKSRNSKIWMNKMKKIVLEKADKDTMDNYTSIAIMVK